MHAELHVPAALLLSFLLVLTRMTGVFVFVPIPGKDAGPNVPRIALALGATLALYARWPQVPMAAMSVSAALAIMASEAALGIAIGLMVSFLTEAFTLGAQALAQQAGYGYASMVDPVSQADSDVLPVMAQLIGSLLFFTAGLHRQLVKIFAASLESYPPGTFALSQNLGREVVRLGAGVFSTGLRLALPIIGLLLMTDLTLALLARINPQLHIGTHALPAKMLVTLLALTSVLALTPSFYARYADEIFTSIRHNFSH